MKKFVVLDVEGGSSVRPYNVGYIITDRNGKIYYTRNAALHPCIHENDLNNYGAEEMERKNVTEIENDSEGKYEHFFSVEEFYKVFLEDMVKYKISKIWAFNCSFDKAAMRRLFSEHEEIINSFEWCDIATAILYTHLLTKKYVKFCRKNEYLTKKGNISTKAEIVYRYLTKDKNFVEEHTGLADCFIEKDILISAISSSKKKVHKEVTQPWLVLKKFCQEKNI